MRFPEFKGGWSNLSIEDVAEVIGGGTPDTRKPDFWDGKIQWFTPTEVGKQKYVISSKRTITELGLSSSSAKLLPKGSILLATRATIGPASISMDSNGVTTNQGFQSLVPKDIEDNEFLFYAIERPEIQKEMNRRSSGSTFNEISHSQVSSIQIGWPSKKERQIISTFLAIIDRRIVVQRKTIEELESLKDVLVRKTTSEDMKLGDLCQAFSSSFKESEVCFEGKYPVYGANGLVGFCNSYQFSNSGVAIIKDGASVGKCFLIPDPRYSVLGTMTLLLPRESTSPTYLYYVLHRINYSQYTVGSGIPHIYFKDYSLARIPKENSYTLSLAACYFRICQKQETVEKERIEINKLKDYLLSSLLI